MKPPLPPPLDPLYVTFWWGVALLLLALFVFGLKHKIST